MSEYVFEPGARFLIHHHPEEQVTLVETGEIEFIVAGLSRQMEHGDWSIVSPGSRTGSLPGRQAHV